MIKGLLAFFVAISAAVIPTQSAYAIEDPTTISIAEVTAYSGAISSGDLLMVVEYDLVYGSIPDETISEAFLGRFKIGQEILGSLVSVEYASVEPYAYNNKGYGKGIFSLYWTSEEKDADSIEFGNTNNEIYQIVLQGKVGVFPGTAPSITTTTIVWQDTANTQSLLFAQVKALAETLQNDAGWTNNTPLISTDGSTTQLTAKGEDYFTNAIPSLGSMIPGIYTTGVQLVNIPPDFHDRSFEDEVDQFWDSDGAWVDERFENLAETFRMPKAVITTMLSLAIMGGVVWGCARLMDNSDRGWEFGLLTIAVTLPLLTAVNWVPMGVTMSVALFALLGIGWTFFLRRAGS